MPCWHLDTVLSAFEMQIYGWDFEKAAIPGQNL